MDANNEFDKLVKDKLAKGNQKVPAELKGLIESRLVREGLIKKSSGNGKWMAVSFSVIAILAILAGGYYYVNYRTKESSSNSGISEKGAPSELSEKGNITEKIKKEEIAEKNNNTSGIPARSTNGSDKILDETVDLSVEKSIVENPVAKKKNSDENDLPVSGNNLSVKKKVLVNTSDRKSIQEKTGSRNSADLKKSIEMPVKEMMKTDTKHLLQDKSATKEQDLASGESTSESLAVNDAGTAKRISSETTDNTTSDANLNKIAINNAESNVNQKSLKGSDNTILPLDSANKTIGPGEMNNSEAGIDSAEIFEAGSTPPSDEKTAPALAETKSDSALTDSLKPENKVMANPADSTKKDSTFLSRYSLEVFAGPQFTMKQGASYTNSKGEELNSARNSEVIIGLKLNYYISKFTIGAGLNYSKHSSEIPSFYNTFYLDTSAVLIPISFAGTITTDYSIVDIPVLIGYNFKGNKFAVHVESGISFSFISDAKSVFALDDTNIVINNFSMLRAEKSYMNYVGQVSFLYSLSKKLQVMIQPSFNYGLSGLFKEIPEEKINVFSLKAGLRLNF